MTELSRLTELATSQRGVISRGQALAHGASVRIITRRLDSGRWTSVTPGVYLFEGSPPGRFRDLWVAHLAIGSSSIVSDEAAAEIHGLPGIPRNVLSMTDKHGRHQHLTEHLPALRLHHSRLMDRIERVEVDGLQVTSVRQTLIDIAGHLGRARVAMAMDHAHAQRLTTYREIAQQVLVFQGTRRRGIGLISSLLAERLDGSAIGDTELEKRLLRIIRSAGLPDPVAQTPLPGRGAMSGLCDFGYHEAKLLLEADGRPWHSRIADIRRDRQRDLEAAAAGWMTIRVMYEDMVNDPKGTGEQIAAAHASRLSGGRAAV